MKTALITGISGQDGAYLANFLLKKNYRMVIGICRYNSQPDLDRLDFLGIKHKVVIEPCNLADLEFVMQVIYKYQPDEIYNLAAQSSVGHSFQIPGETFTYNTLSVMNQLEAIRQLNKEIRFYQASSSEMFGNVDLRNLPIKESLLFHPVSPYGISKASAHWLTVNYREAYGLFTACGILFNHESVLRGEHFVIKKLINTALKIKSGEADTLTLGNLAIRRDWGYAPKYVEAMWSMLQQENPSDYIICSGNLITLQDLVLKVFDQLGLELNKHLRLDQRFMRSLDLSIIYGDNSKARKDLGWEYDLSTDDLVSLLIKEEHEWLKWKKKKSE